MDPNGLLITRHAFDRFVTRWPGEDPPVCYLAALRRLLEAAVDEDLGSGQVVRLINHGLQPAKYLTADGWRFVLTEDSRRLLTCERVIFKARPKAKFKPRRRR